MVTLRRLFQTALPLAFVLAFSPAAAQAKSKKTQTVQCNDGTTSKAGRGACSHHGGVASTTSGAKRDDADQSSGAQSKTKASSSSRSEGRAAPRLERAPAAEPAPSTAQSSPATVQCKDGTTSKAGRGACSHHGGVASAANDAGRERIDEPAAAPRELPPSSSPAQGREAPRPERAPATERTPSTGQPTARCKDGSFSYAKQHSGACSHHGGVAEWLQ